MITSAHALGVPGSAWTMAGGLLLLCFFLFLNMTSVHFNSLQMIQICIVLAWLGGREGSAWTHTSWFPETGRRGGGGAVMLMGCSWAGSKGTVVWGRASIVQAVQGSSLLLKVPRKLIDLKGKKWGRGGRSRVVAIYQYGKLLQRVWDAWRSDQTWSTEHLVSTHNTEPVHIELIQNRFKFDFSRYTFELFQVDLNLFNTFVCLSPSV